MTSTVRTVKLILKALVLQAFVVEALDLEAKIWSLSDAPERRAIT
jgi:hypothetical protein